MLPVNPPYTIAAGTPLRDATGDTIPVLTPSDIDGTVLNPASFSPAKTGNGTNALTLGLFNVNGVTGVHSLAGDYTVAPHQASARYATIGDTIELQVTNTSGLHHPFHMHGFSFQPVTLTRANNPTFTFPPEFVDAVDIPPNFTLTYRFKVEDRPQMDGTTPGGAAGRWVFHCHIFIHAHLGMISELVVTDPDGNERPYVDMTPTSVKRTRATSLRCRARSSTPTVTRSRCPQTSARSSTTTTARGPGADDTAGAPATQPVFITGTDPQGLTGQVEFDLDVAQAPAATPLYRINAGGPTLSDPGGDFIGVGSVEHAGPRRACTLTVTAVRRT